MLTLISHAARTAFNPSDNDLDDERHLYVVRSATPASPAQREEMEQRLMGWDLRSCRESLKQSRSTSHLLGFGLAFAAAVIIYKAVRSKES